MIAWISLGNCASSVASRRIATLNAAAYRAVFDIQSTWDAAGSNFVRSVVSLCRFIKCVCAVIVGNVMQ